VRYFLDTDEDCHWYLIPERLRAIWESRENFEGFDFDGNGVVSLGGNPNKVTFALPMLYDEPVGEWTT